MRNEKATPGRVASGADDASTIPDLVPGVNGVAPWWHPIPEDMRQARRWLVWRLELAGGRWTKKPYQTNGRLASSTDPHTWGSFDDCRRLVPRYSGIGFALGDGWCCVDLDHCRDAQSELIETWAMDILHKLRVLGHYIEVSPSGHGIHAFFRGKLPDGRRKQGNVEAYDAGRYMTVTGRALDWDTV